MRLLIGCHSMVATGGLLRFERVGAILQRMGHELAFCVRSIDGEFGSDRPVVKFQAASKQDWDAVLIPGAGFPDATIASFSDFRASQFGVRIQMVLNDQHVRARFLSVNTAFAPQLVVFNNEHWPVGSYQDFAASQFHHLIGATDTRLFQPAIARRSAGCFVIGAQVSKNPGPLLAALPLLPADCHIRFFGFDRHDALAACRADPRVSQTGPLFGKALAAYYHDIDVMVSTEPRAGWANVVAEAMASGTPVITTPAGTLSIARHNETALIVAQPTPQSLAQNIIRLKQDPALGAALSKQGRAAIETFDWKEYTEGLIELIDDFVGSNPVQSVGPMASVLPIRSSRIHLSERH